jgi:small-conductance mechanosensitive channel
MMVETGDKESTPRPDPTKLTTEQLVREIGALREILETRMDGQDELIKLVQNSLLKRRSDIIAETSHLNTVIVEKFNVVDEKFESVQKQFMEKDKRAEQSATAAKEAVATASQAAKEAVAAALQAAKEAVAAALQAAKELGTEQNKSSAEAIYKNEAATNNQISQLGGLISATKQANDDKISDLKDRVNTIEARSVGGKENKDDFRSIAALMVSVVVAVGGLVAFFYHNQVSVVSGQPQPQVVYIRPDPQLTPVPVPKAQ